MTPETDSDFLRQFVESQSNEAFAGLVARHVNMVHSVAFRQVNDPTQAEEITQAVFIILAKKAGTIRHQEALSSWLFQTTRLTAKNFLRGELRRQRREQEAYMESTLIEPAEDAWPSIGPLLDGAVEKLGETDRRAILLRFYEGRNLREVGVALGMSEDTAKKRVNRALEKLRKFFTRRGVTLSATALAGAVSANAVQAAPAGLALKIPVVAAKGAAATGAVNTLVKGALKIMAWTKAKTILAVAIGILVAASTTTVVVKELSTSDDPWVTMDNINPELAKLDPPGNPFGGDDAETHWKKIDAIYAAHFKNVPAGVFIRPTLYPDRDGTSAATKDENQFIGRNLAFSQILLSAYYKIDENGLPFSSTRMVVPADLPPGNYDFGVNVPGQGLERFQGQIKNQFGLAGHFENTETNVLALVVKNTNAPGLKPGAGFLPMSHSTDGTAELAQYLEGRFHHYVVDEARLRSNSQHIRVFRVPFAGKDLDSAKKTLLDQYGLELVPTNLPIEMLVVEKIR